MYVYKYTYSYTIYTCICVYFEENAAETSQTSYTGTKDAQSKVAGLQKVAEKVPSIRRICAHMSLL